MKCLVTGGAGFIGSNLALELERLGHKTAVYDNFSTGNKNNLMGFKGIVKKIDISKPFTKKEKFNAIFHQASITDPRNPNDKKTLNENIRGFLNILNLAKSQRAVLIYASTASLYGNTPSPQREDQPKELLSAYAKSKLIIDEMASHNWREMSIIGLRYFNVFGPGEKYKGNPASMIYHLSTQMIKGKQPKLFKYGKQSRDHIYVKDCVRANILALKAPSGVYNIGTGVATSFNSLVKYINKALKTKLKPKYIDMNYDPKTYQVNTCADTKRAKKYLKFKTKYSTEKGIKDYLKYLDN